VPCANANDGNNAMMAITGTIRTNERINSPPEP
jgi:hypothetical protein